MYFLEERDSCILPARRSWLSTLPTELAERVILWSLFKITIIFNLPYVGFSKRIFLISVLQESEIPLSLTFLGRYRTLNQSMVAKSIPNLSTCFFNLIVSASANTYKFLYNRPRRLL